MEKPKTASNQKLLYGKSAFDRRRTEFTKKGVNFVDEGKKQDDISKFEN
jgi:hypothetical protein